MRPPFYVILAVASFFASECFAQTYQTTGPLVEKAKSLADGLTAKRSSLPSRWAALQRTYAENSFKKAKGQIAWERIDEFCAHDVTTGVTYRRVKRVDGLVRNQQVTQASDMWTDVAYSYAVDGKIYYKDRRKDWHTVLKLPGSWLAGADPFTRCIGFHAAARFGYLQETYSQELFHRDGRECLGARQLPDRVVAIWGSERTPAYRVGFDGKTGLPVEFALALVKPNSTKEEILQADFSKFESGQVEWKSYKKSNGGEWILPVKVRVHSTLNDDEIIDCTTDIDWLLEDAVPDSVFVDPREQQVIEPEFPEAKKVNARE